MTGHKFKEGDRAAIVECPFLSDHSTVGLECTIAEVVGYLASPGSYVGRWTGPGGEVYKVVCQRPTDGQDIKFYAHELELIKICKKR